MVRLTDRPDMIVDAYRGRKSTIQQQQPGQAENKSRARGYKKNSCSTQLSMKF